MRPLSFMTEYHYGAGAPMGEAPLLNRELQFCREQLVQVLVELTDRIGIGTDKRKRHARCVSGGCPAQKGLCW